MRVVLADDHPLVRSGIRLALAERQDLEVVAEVGTGDAALAAVREHRPDLLILDIFMPGMASDEVVALATAAHPELKTLILTAYDDDIYVHRLTRVAIRGYMLKDEAPENLLRAISCIEQGAMWFSQSVSQKIMSGGGKQPQSGDCDTLSERERQVLVMLSRGEDNREIARALQLAEQTVRNYVSTLYSKIQVTTRVEAVLWARERDIQ